jgi:hypothetical protein
MQSANRQLRTSAWEAFADTIADANAHPHTYGHAHTDRFADYAHPQPDANAHPHKYTDSSGDVLRLLL